MLLLRRCRLLRLVACEGVSGSCRAVSLSVARHPQCQQDTSLSSRYHQRFLFLFVSERLLLQRVRRSLLICLIVELCPQTALLILVAGREEVGIEIQTIEDQFRRGRAGSTQIPSFRN